MKSSTMHKISAREHTQTDSFLLHKVQKNLESQDVAGAEFTLSKLDSSGWTICKNSLVTDQTGEIHFAKAATESPNSAQVEYDTLYKLVEIKST